MSSFASKPRRSATANASPSFEPESPNGTQAAPIPIDDDDEDESSSFNTAVASPNKRKRDNSAFIISDDEDDKKTTVKSRKTTKSQAKPTVTTPEKKNIIPLTWKQKKSKVPSPEKRLRPYRNHAPQTYQARYERALAQRMFLIHRQKTTKSDEHGEYEEEVFDMVGTTGNVYQVTISKVPKCTCPDWRNNRGQCKHIIYVSSSLYADLNGRQGRTTANFCRFLSTSSNVPTISNTSLHTCRKS